MKGKEEEKKAREIEKQEKRGTREEKKEREEAKAEKKYWEEKKQKAERIRERGIIEKQKTRAKSGQRELEAKFEHLRIAINSSDETDSELETNQQPEAY